MIKYLCFLGILSFIALNSCNPIEEHSIKLDGSSSIIFKDGDIIYFVDLDTSCVTFHCTDNPIVKTKKWKDINLSDYAVDIKDTTIKNNIFYSLEQGMLDLSPSLKQYIADDYNKFALDLSTDFKAMSKYKNKHLVVKQIERNKISGMLKNEYYYTLSDSLQTARRIKRNQLNIPSREGYYHMPLNPMSMEITVPQNTADFCKAIKAEYPDAGYIMLNSHVYMTYNIFLGGLCGGEDWCDDAYSFAPLIVIDVKNAKILSIDYRMLNAESWIDMVQRKHHMEDEAEYYKLFY